MADPFDAIIDRMTVDSAMSGLVGTRPKPDMATWGNLDLPLNIVVMPDRDFLKIQASLKARGLPYDAQSVSGSWVQHRP